MLNADAHFRIGKTHTVCQDYATVGEKGDLSYVLVSDGCSSSPHTDFGSRFLIQAVSQIASTEGSFSPHAVIWLAHSYARQMGLPPECLDATLMALFSTPQRTRVLVTGDGVVAARSRDGKLCIWVVEFNLNAPAYLSYLLSEDRMKTLIDGYGGGKRTVHYYEEGNLFGVTRSEVTARGEENGITWTHDFDPSRYDLVLVSTDGAHTYQRRDASGYLASVPVAEVIAAMMQVPRPKGRFMVRQFRILDRQIEQHGDDHAAAAMFLTEGSEP